MNKKDYEKAEITITLFGEDDVITMSGFTYFPEDDDLEILR